MGLQESLASFAASAVGLLLFVLCLPRCVLSRVRWWRRLDEETVEETTESVGAKMSKSEHISTEAVVKSDPPFTVQIVDDTAAEEAIIIPAGVNPPPAASPKGLDDAIMGRRGDERAGPSVPQNKEPVAQPPALAAQVSPFAQASLPEPTLQIKPLGKMQSDAAQFSNVPPPDARKVHRTRSAPLSWSFGNEAEAAVIPEAAKKVVCAVASDIGGRRSMEDAHFWATSGLDRVRALIGVFDGHNGVAAAEFSAENFVDFFMQAAGGVEDALRTAFSTAEKALHGLFTSGQLGDAGTTALVLALGEDELHVANVGDCRAVKSQNGRAEPLSRDQKPGCPEEKARILAAGGFLDGEEYVNGEIGVARALGDFHLEDLKKVDGTGPLIATPEITSHAIDKETEFVVLACDGLWDVISNQRAIEMARRALEDGLSPKEAAEKLVLEAKLQCSRDNITVAVLAIAPLPLPPRRPVRPRFVNSRLRLNSRSLLDLKSALDKAEQEDPLEIVIV